MFRKSFNVIGPCPHEPRNGLWRIICNIVDVDNTEIKETVCEWALMQKWINYVYVCMNQLGVCVYESIRCMYVDEMLTTHYGTCSPNAHAFEGLGS